MGNSARVERTRETRMTLKELDAARQKWEAESDSFGEWMAWLDWQSALAEYKAGKEKQEETPE